MCVYVWLIWLTASLVCDAEALHNLGSRRPTLSEDANELLYGLESENTANELSDSKGGSENLGPLEANEKRVKKALAASYL